MSDIGRKRAKPERHLLGDNCAKCGEPIIYSGLEHSPPPDGIYCPDCGFRRMAIERASYGLRLLAVAQDIREATNTVGRAKPQTVRRSLRSVARELRELAEQLAAGSS